MWPTLWIAKLRLALRVVCPGPVELWLMLRIHRSGLFDAVHYRAQLHGINRIWHLFPLRHYLVRGERLGLRPNPDFAPDLYLKLNPDVAEAGISPIQHFLNTGRAEGRPISAQEAEHLPTLRTKIPRFDPSRPKARFALCLHLHYPDLWPEFRDRLRQLTIDFDLYVTLTYRGAETAWLSDEIAESFPKAQVFPVANRGRDILPFLLLVNAHAFDGYEAVCKLHGKKSLHRDDGDIWRQHLVAGLLPAHGLTAKVEQFLSDRDAALWVADGQNFAIHSHLGSNREKTEAVLRRIELDRTPATYTFPAGSMYWAKPLMIGMIRALNLTEAQFEPEDGQIDGTLAHAVERAIGGIAQAAGQKIIQASELGTASKVPIKRPRYVSAFYLPQFHPIPENDAWWGAGFTEWTAVHRAQSLFPGHLQPAGPGALGHYDLRHTDTMGEQATLARNAGIDGFCVYHYWFGGKRLLEQPLQRLLDRPDIDFPFYLCWANEAWRRNWDGLSGETLIDQPYGVDFEADLVASSLPYMRDPRYQRPDGRRPRFVIYRPEDMPAPMQNVARLRKAWRAAGIGEVELGAVNFHLAGEHPVPEGLFDFWIEMPPHGLVDSSAYLFGGPQGNRMGHATPAPGFQGLIYDYQAVAKRSLSQAYRNQLPEKTIVGIMPSWDNTARRQARAHIAHGANPATFRRWLHSLCNGPLETSYRGELFINAWNEWAEKAMMEPSQLFGGLNLSVLAEVTGAVEKTAGQKAVDHA